MEELSKITIFAAKKIITMNASLPQTTHVAVRNGYILGAGTLDELRGWGDYKLDTTFAGKVLIPGLIEGHAHAFGGALWAYPYVGSHDRIGPDGRLWKGCKSVEEVVVRLKETESMLANPDEPVLAWGLDPIYFTGPEMTASDLDRVSSTRPVVVAHLSFHLLNVNTVVLKRSGITADTRVEGITKGPDGQPTGELREMAAMFFAFKVAGANLFLDEKPTPEGVWSFGRMAQLVGCTTVTDLGTDLKNQPTLDVFRETTGNSDFPIRIVQAHSPLQSVHDAEKSAQYLTELSRTSTEKLRYGKVKLFTDGAIQGFTARLKWPGYYNGHPNGVWNTSPDQLKEQVLAYHKAGIHINVHCNGDEASEVFLGSVEAALEQSPRWEHRHTVQHSQLAHEGQFRHMVQLGMCANIFANHIYFWGDAHYSQTLGPERANRMDACSTAKRCGVHFSIHSDNPVTPIGPLFTAWCAVNRMTASGRVLGESERIPVQDALYAVTLDAAYLLKMDHEIGSIEIGKRADFCVLEEDPLTAPPELLKDVPVWGTVLGGQVFQSPKIIIGD